MESVRQEDRNDALGRFRWNMTNDPRLRDLVFELASWLAHEEEQARLRASTLSWEPKHPPAGLPPELLNSLLELFPEPEDVAKLLGELRLSTAVAPKPTNARGVPEAPRAARARKAKPRDPQSLVPLIESVQIKLSVLDLRLEAAMTPDAESDLRDERLGRYHNLMHATKRECWPLDLPVPATRREIRDYEATRDVFLVMANTLRLCRAARQLEGRSNTVLGKAVGLLMRCVRMSRPVISRTHAAVRIRDVDVEMIEAWCVDIRKVRKLEGANCPRIVNYTIDALSSLNEQTKALEATLDTARLESRIVRQATTEARQQDKELVVGSRSTTYQEVADHALRIVNAADRYHRAGGSPGDPSWQSWVTRAIDVIRDTYPIPTGAEIIYNEAEWERAQRAAPPPQAPSATLLKARSLLEGRSAVVIGGVPHKHNINSLREELGLKDLSWPETRRHEDFGKYEHEMRREDVTLLLFVVKIADHFYADRLRAIARERNIAMVHIKAGYSPEQVAKDIVEQASHILSRREHTPVARAI